MNGKLVFGISVAEKRAFWLRVTAHGIAGHGSQPHDHNPNDKLMQALDRLFSAPFPTVPNAVLDALVGRQQGHAHGFLAVGHGNPHPPRGGDAGCDHGEFWRFGYNQY